MPFKRKSKKKNFIRFSKKCITAMVVLWFVTTFTCIGVVLVQLCRGDITVNTSDLVTLVSAPITGGILGYMVKSAFEDNKKQNNTMEDNSI